MARLSRREGQGVATEIPRGLRPNLSLTDTGSSLNTGGEAIETRRQSHERYMHTVPPPVVSAPACATARKTSLPLAVD
jgi:hypothetical protein